MQQKALTLALAVYRVTKLFPEGEVLISQLRQIANEIIYEIALKNDLKAIFKIKALINLFTLAQAQKWTKDINFVILIKEYNFLLAEIKSQKILIKKGKISQRQKKIISYLKTKQNAKISDLSALFPEINLRTIGNDLNELVRQKYLIKKGQGRATFYKLNQENHEIS